MKCEGVAPGDDDVDRRKLGLKYLKSSSKPHLNLIVNLSRWCYRKSPKILSHDHGHEGEIVFVFCFFPKTKVLLSFGLDNVFGDRIAPSCLKDVSGPPILRSILQAEFTKLRIQRW